MDIQPFSATLESTAGDEPATIAVRGELDLATAYELATLFDEVFEDVQADIILDFSDLAFIDSSGIAVLLAAHARLKSIGHHLSIRNAGPQPWKIFEVTDLLDLLEVSASAKDRPIELP